jgi:peroxiredoxin
LTIVALVILPGGRLGSAENPARRKSPSADASAAARPAKRVDFDNPIVQLARDPAVRKELALTPQQTRALDSAYAEIEARLFVVRDATTGQAAEEKARLLTAMERRAETILDERQLVRLRQLVARARGWAGIIQEPTSAQLKLSADQIGEIEQIIERTRQEMQKISSSSDPPAARGQAAAKIRTEEGAAIQKRLSPEQRQILARLVGAAFDLGQVRPLSFQAPALRAVDAWVNTSPIKLADLHGKVVAFHFWAFNCGNCINNLPHYNTWHDQLASRGLVVLGMHTPETAAERSVESLRTKVDQYTIRYPVAVDHEAANWSAWANSMWPSVYLVDKQGRVRYWWYGELNWQGAEGEKFMRQRIEQLLDE